MNTTKFDNLVFASRKAAQDQLQVAHLNIQGGQPGSTAAVQNASAPPGQAVPAPVAAISQPQGAVDAQAGQPSAIGAQKKKNTPRRKKDDNQPKRPRGRPRKYPLPEGLLTNGMAVQQVSRPAAAPFVNGASPLGVPNTRPTAALSNGVRLSTASQQNGASQPGMSLYEAWSKNQGAAFLGSPSKQAPLYLQRAHQQQQAQQHPQGQPQEHLNINAMVPNGFLALMQEYAQTELAGNAQDGSQAIPRFPANSLPQAQSAAAAAAPSMEPPAATATPQAPIPISSQADACMPPVPPPVPQPMVPGLTTRSPSRRKPQKLPLVGPASPIRAQQALAANTPMLSPTRQGVPGGSPAKLAASSPGRSRAQRKNAATPQRVVPGVAAAAASPAQAAAPGASAGPQQAAVAAAPAAASPQRPQQAAAVAAAPASAVPQVPQQAASQQPQRAGAGTTGSPGHSRPSEFNLDGDPSAHGGQIEVEVMDYPGVRPSKRPRKTKLLTEVAKSEPEQPEQGVHSLPPWHISESGKKRRAAGQDREAVEAAARQSGGAALTKGAQPQVTGPTDISEAATVSDHAHPGRKKGVTAKRPADSSKALARRKVTAAAERQARSAAAPSPSGRRQAAPARASQSEPNAAGQLPAASSSDRAAVQALLQATASPVLQRTENSAVASPSTAATSAPPQQARAPQQQPAQAAVARSDEGAATVVANATAQPVDAAAANVAAVRRPVDELAPLLASRLPDAASDQRHTKPGDAAAGRRAAQAAPAGTAIASQQAVAEAASPSAAAAAVSAAQVPPAAAQQSAQDPTLAGTPPAPASSAPERQQSPSAAGRSQQNSAGVGALKEELNNILISCLAEEAKRAHAAQEAIEICRAAEEGLEHLHKQYVMQENFSTSYEDVVDEVSNALQATSAANRQVQEVQERLNAVQEELKLVVANAELARSHAMTVLRKQAQLKEEMEAAREEVSRILHQPQTDLEQLRDTVNAQTEHVGNMRAAREAAIESLVQCRADKDQLLSLMNADPPPSFEALAAAGLRLAGNRQL